MAEDIANDLVYWMEIGVQHKNFLGQVRHWDNLKIATDESSIWIKDFTTWQLQDNTLLSIPFIRFYYCKDNMLFPKGSLLPSHKLPGFLWTPIERAFPVELKGFNHNFFGVGQQQSIQLVPLEEEQHTTVLLVDITVANKYITTAPAIRLQHLQWVLVNNDTALIIGDPLLPINGETYWQKGHFIFPAGYGMQFPILENTVAQLIDVTENYLIWWTSEKEYGLVDVNLLQPLSIASWRQTVLLH